MSLECALGAEWTSLNVVWVSGEEGRPTTPSGFWPSSWKDMVACGEQGGIGALG